MPIPLINSILRSADNYTHKAKTQIYARTPLDIGLELDALFSKFESHGLTNCVEMLNLEALPNQNGDLFTTFLLTIKIHGYDNFRKFKDHFALGQSLRASR